MTPQPFTGAAAGERLAGGEREPSRKAPCYRQDIADRSGILAPPPADRETVPEPARVVTVWEGHAWTEIDAATGEVIANGNTGGDGND